MFLPLTLFKYIFFSLFALFFLSACSENGIDKLNKGDTLSVITRNAPTTWYEGPEGLAGLEYELVQSFAKKHQLKVSFKVMDSIEEMLTAIKENNNHFVAAGITRSDNREDEGFEFGPDYQQVQQLVICRRGAERIPKKTEDLIGLSLTVIAGSTYEETLKELKDDHPELLWKVETDADTEQLLEQVWKKKFDCTISDSNIFSINRRYYPELLMAFPVSEEQPLAWVLAPEWSGLDSAMEDWLDEIEASGELASLMERYYGHVENYDYVDISRLKRRIKSRLPEYEALLKKAAKKSGFTWTFLAAVSYQESHWSATSRSPTGVRGFMMLTKRTARSLGVTNRLDAAQSIDAGARYLKKILDRIPESVQEQDRMWYALTAYNIGYGHLMDARLLAKRKGKNPDLWVELKTVLPLLSKKKYYRTLKHGYARGIEPIRYVQRVREYQQVIDQLTGS